jgi:hypothetical protein
MTAFWSGPTISDHLDKRVGTTAQIFLAILHIFSMFAVDAGRINILLAVHCLSDEELSRSMGSLKVVANRKFNL